MQSNSHVFGFQTEIMPMDTEVIVSEPVEILKDAKGKREYRCFVVARVSSVSPWDVN
jgi:hypothetical protein